MTETERTSEWRLGYRPALDGIRAIAVALVLAGHFSVPFLRTAGAVGVTCFFVLSGFLITALLLEERERTGRIALRAFYARRAFRLLPALAVVVAFYVLVGTAALGFDVVLPRALAAMFYVANWVNQEINLGALFHTWSLGVEEQFYAVWPALLIVGLTFGGRRTVAVICAALLAGAVGFRAFGISGVGELDRSIDALMVGCLLAIVATANRMPRWRWAGYLGIVTLAIGALLPLEPAWREGWTFGLLAVGVATVGLVIGVCAGENRLERLLSARPLVAVGKVSYGLYLWHFIVLWLLGPALTPLGWFIAAPVLTAVSLLCAGLSWRYVEQPVARFRSRRSLPARVAAADQTPIPALS